MRLHTQTRPTCAFLDLPLRWGADRKWPCLAHREPRAKGCEMLRLTELTLPLHHADEALPAAICKRLRITPRDLIRHVIARRAHDARDKANIQLVYSVDVNVKDERTVLARFRKD